MTASQLRICDSEIGRRKKRKGAGSWVWALSSWRRRFVDGGVGEREEGAIFGVVCSGSQVGSLEVGVWGGVSWEEW